MERFQYKIERFLKDFSWHVDYVVWLLFSPYKFKRLPKNIESVLVVEDIGIGDLLVTTPVIRALKRKYGRVDVLVKKGMEGVLEGNPHVDNVITELEGDYDLGVILHARTFGNYKLSEALRQHCRFRIGCTRVGLREGKGFFLHRKTVPSFKIKTKIQDNLDVIKTIDLRGEEHLEAYTDIVPPVKNYVVFHTHGAFDTHNWYKEKWAALGKKIDEHIVFTGVKKEYVNDIISMMGKDATNATLGSIQEYFSWIKHAKYVVTVDTSAMHVAAAFNKKVISLFGAGDHRVWKPNPQTKESVVITKGDCHSCHKHHCKLQDHRCMKLIEAKDVLEHL